MHHIQPCQATSRPLNSLFWRLSILRVFPQVINRDSVELCALLIIFRSIFPSLPHQSLKSKPETAFRKENSDLWFCYHAKKVKVLDIYLHFGKKMLNREQKLKKFTQTDNFEIMIDKASEFRVRP